MDWCLLFAVASSVALFMVYDRRLAVQISALPIPEAREPVYVKETRAKAKLRRASLPLFAIRFLVTLLYGRVLVNAVDYAQGAGFSHVMSTFTGIVTLACIEGGLLWIELGFARSQGFLLDCPSTIVYACCKDKYTVEEAALLVVASYVLFGSLIVLVLGPLAALLYFMLCVYLTTAIGPLKYMVEEKDSRKIHDIVPRTTKEKVIEAAKASGLAIDDVLVLTGSVFMAHGQATLNVPVGPDGMYRRYIFAKSTEPDDLTLDEDVLQVGAVHSGMTALPGVRSIHRFVSLLANFTWLPILFFFATHPAATAEFGLPGGWIGETLCTYILNLSVSPLVYMVASNTILTGEVLRADSLAGLLGIDVNNSIRVTTAMKSGVNWFGEPLNLCCGALSPYERLRAFSAPPPPPRVSGDGMDGFIWAFCRMH